MPENGLQQSAPAPIPPGRFPTKSRFQKRLDQMRREIGDRDRQIEDLKAQNLSLANAVVRMTTLLARYKQKFRTAKRG